MDFVHTEGRRMQARSLNRLIAEQCNFEIRTGALFCQGDGGLAGAGFDSGRAA